mmetsp:Transcript_3719/g.8979  ORF Transcript_3719/g.8979 Transcript_3719/m.8979 type:complete len:239 (+) Transcript_3719:87-803(+)
MPGLQRPPQEACAHARCGDVTAARPTEFRDSVESPAHLICPLCSRPRVQTSATSASAGRRMPQRYPPCGACTRLRLGLRRATKHSSSCGEARSRKRSSLDMLHGAAALQHSEASSPRDRRPQQVVSAALLPSSTSAVSAAAALGNGDASASLTASSSGIKSFNSSKARRGPEVRDATCAQSWSKPSISTLLSFNQLSTTLCAAFTAEAPALAAACAAQSSSPRVATSCSAASAAFCAA